MFARIATFEIRYLLRNPLLWLTALAVFLLPFASLALGFDLEEDMRVFKNSPYEVISKYRIISCLFMFATTVFVSNIVLRDDESEFGPILRSIGVGKFDYLFGRFVGAMVVVALCLALVTPGIWLGSLMPWVDPASVGPNRVGDHLFAYFLIALPNVLITASIFFALATVSRSMMGTYLGLIVFLGLYFSLLSALGSRPDLIASFAIAEPFSARAFDDAVRYWTTVERNTLLPKFSGALLINRLLWMGISCAFLVLAYVGFNFTKRGGSRRRRTRQKLEAAGTANSLTGHVPLGPLPRPSHGLLASWSLLRVRCRFEIKQVVKSPAFILLMVWAAFLTNFALITDRDPDGRPTYPVTAFTLPDLKEIFLIIPLVLVIIYTGELVWRERDRRMHEIVDAAPHPNWAYVVPKMMAIALLLFGVFSVSALVTVGLQLSLGYTRIEPGTYLLWYILPMTWEAMLVAALATFVQVLSPHKFIGWGIMVLYVAAVFTNVLPEHNLLRYAGIPPEYYSDMDGVSSFWEGPWVFRLYWGAGAAMLLVAAHLLWRRGTEIRFRPRLAHAFRNFGDGTRLLGGAALLIFAASGAYAFYNTNVLNRFEKAEAGDEYWAGYEKKYLKFADLPQPSVAHMKLGIAIFPDDRRATVQGDYQLENRTARPIRDIHIKIPDRDLQLLQLAIAGGRLLVEDTMYDHRIFRLDRPMLPGETRRLTFRTQRWHRGFPNGAPNTTIVENGTFLSYDELVPAIGVRTQPLVLNPNARKRFGLGEASRGQADDPSAINKPADERSWSTADITLSTTAGQTPMAPGKKVSDVTRNGRRTARFISETPIRTTFSVQSGRYAEKHRLHRGVDLAVYYDPRHPWNAEHMLSMLQASLDYFEANFGPYQFDQARIVEFPSYKKNYGQAFANTVPTAETRGFISDLRAPDALDEVTGMMAHELSHQYWGHQIAPAAAQGSLLLVETLAQYSTLMVMKRIHGPDMLRRQMQRQLDTYLAYRAVSQADELPLARTEKQTFVIYNKGAVAMALIQERLGEEAVNRALRRLLAHYRFKGATYPTSLDLIRELRAEAKDGEQQMLITDLLERVIVYDLRASSPTARRLPGGKWEVSVPVEARKFSSGRDGVETEVPLRERIEIGVFVDAPGSGAFDRRNVISIERRPIRSGKQILKFVVDRKPLHAGIDPYTYYIDRNSADNLAPVTFE